MIHSVQGKPTHGASIIILLSIILMVVLVFAPLEG